MQSHRDEHVHMNGDGLGHDLVDSSQSKHSSSRLLANEETDDFFGDQADTHENEEARRQRELEALRRPHFTAGVREGVSTSHEASLQDGFDDGFSAGVSAVTEASFLYGATSMALAFYARHGCTPRAETTLQTLGDTGIPTKDLQQLSSAMLKLRADIRQVPVDGTVQIEHARKALTSVSLVQVPDDIRSGSDTGSNGADQRNTT